MPKNSSNSVPVPVIPSNSQLSFSFEFYDTTDDAYCLSKFSSDQVKLSMKRLKEVSAKTFNEMQRQKAVLHFGEVIWSKTIKPNGFEQPALEGLEPFHFALLGVNGQLTRVFGAYGSNVFYVVWFDLEHKIWPSKLRNT